MKNIISINKENKGFTLVELLAVIAVLSVIITIIIYSAINIVKKAKEKSYQATINYIEAEADDLVVEELTNTSWITGYNGTYQYQCITVKNLIETGHFKNDILDSYVDEDRKVLSSDSIYLERDTISKVITKNKLILDDRFKSLCDIPTSGVINLVVNPSKWSREKNVSISYTLENTTNYSNYKYGYYLYNEETVTPYELKDSAFTKNNENTTLNVIQNGHIYTEIIDNENNLLISNTGIIDKIDRINPYGSINQDGSNITINMNDDLSGLSKYYFGQINPNTNKIEWEEINDEVNEEITTATSENVETGNDENSEDITPNAKPIKSININTNITNSGLWYLAIQDNAENETIISKEMEKIETYTIKYISNGGNGTMETTTCNKGSNCTISNNKYTRNGYNFAGWTTKANGTDDGYNWTNWSGKWEFENGQKGIKNNTLTLYARWSGKTYTITYEANGGYSSAADEKENAKYCIKQTIDNHDIKGTMTTQTCTYGSPCTLKVNEYQRQCHLFKGWTRNTDTESTDYTEVDMSVSDTDNFYEDQDTFTYNIIGNITLYAVWKSNHTYKAIGNQVHKTTGTYTCGYDHDHSYMRYCSVCQMSAKNYNLCYKPQYEKDQSNKFCPCGTGAATTTLDDHYQFNRNGNQLEAMPYNGKVDELVKGFGGILSNQQFDRIQTGNTAPVICDNHKAFKITLNKQSGTRGTSTIYGVYISTYKIDEKYRYNLFLELSSNDVYTKQMTSKLNPITIPIRSNYTFDGYYTKTSGNGIQIIDSSGYLIQNSSEEQYSNSITLYAKWIKK